MNKPFILCLSCLLSFGCVSTPPTPMIGPVKDVVLDSVKYDYLRQLTEEEDMHLLGKTKEDILIQFGNPLKKRTYTLNDVERDHYVYRFAKDDFIERRMWLEVFFIDEKVSGYNLYTGDKPDLYRPPSINENSMIAGGF